MISWGVSFIPSRAISLVDIAPSLLFQALPLISYEEVFWYGNSLEQVNLSIWLVWQGESLESVSRVGYKNVTLHRQLCHTRLTSCFRHYYGGVPSQTRLTSRPLTWFHAFHSVILTPQGKLAAMRHSIWSPLAWPTVRVLNILDG
jgi:hypothetical protein